MSIGLTKDQVIKKLQESGIESGKPSSAEQLNEAIAEIITANNGLIEAAISKAINDKFNEFAKKITGSSTRISKGSLL